MPFKINIILEIVRKYFPFVQELLEGTICDVICENVPYGETTTVSLYICCFHTLWYYSWLWSHIHCKATIMFTLGSLEQHISYALIRRRELRRVVWLGPMIFVPRYYIFCRLYHISKALISYTISIAQNAILITEEVTYKCTVHFI